MDKQMIEEMAKIMFEKAFENYETSGSAEIDTEARRHCYSAFLTYCEKLYEAGYRKIPENAVVLTEEESVKAWENGNCNAHAIYGLAYKQARKETAEKFAERLKEKLNEWLEDNEDLDGKIDFGIAQIELIGVKSLDGEIIAESLIDEICKEITDKEVQNGN